MYTAADLFAGIGGIRIGFERAFGNEIETVYISEKDKFARQTYEANFGTVPAIDGDITKLDVEDIPLVDIVLAGFPCQPFSIAGVSKKNSLGIAHGFADKTQGTLFFDVARIIEAKQPKAFLLENVKNLKSHDNGNTWKVIESTLTEELGYHIFPKILDAANWTCQHRERIYIVGFKDDLSFDWDNLEINKIHTCVKDILEDNVNNKFALSDKLWKCLQEHAAKHASKGNRFGYGIVTPESKKTRTLSARYYKDGSEILLEQPHRNPRRLTPRECARLQGFPDEFEIPVSNSQAWHQFGNSVSIPVVESIAKLMKEALDSN